MRVPGAGCMIFTAQQGVSRKYMRWHPLSTIDAEFIASEKLIQHSKRRRRLCPFHLPFGYQPSERSSVLRLTSNISSQHYDHSLSNGRRSYDWEISQR